MGSACCFGLGLYAAFSTRIRLSARRHCALRRAARVRGDRRKSKPAPICWHCSPATALTQVIFFGEDRYHLVVTPMLCILAAAALRKSGARGDSVTVR